jgi:ATP-dependent helicase/nuclease subunit A
MTSLAQLTGHTTVQASAGSGKTYLLISRIVRLLLTGADSGNILAITFTKKAANEMQTRLLERLYELATCDDTKLKKILNELHLEVTANLITQARSLYEQTLRTESPVKTSTFHAFCQELLRRFPMEANVAPGFDLLDKTGLLYDEAWQALMVAANKEVELADALHLLFSELGLYNAKQALRNFIDHRSDWWAYTADEDNTVQYAQQQLQQQLGIDASVDPVESLFNDKNNITLINEFHVLLCKHETKKNKEVSDAIYKLIDDNTKQKEFFTLIKECFLTKTGTVLVRKESNVQEKKMGADGQARFLEIHESLSQKIIDTNLALAAIRTLKTSSAWYVAGQAYLNHFQKLKSEQRLLDFTDLEWQTYLLLNQSNNALWIQYKLDQRIEHLLVDEFQDTNPTQWRLILPLLEEIAASDDERQRSVFIVGDEKQSIYRFRRAEPRLFAAAEQWLRERLNATTCPLSHSWRSSPAIINFVNTVFTQNKFKVLLPNFIEHDTHRKDLSGNVTLLPLSVKEVDDSEKNESSVITLRNPLTTPREENYSEQYFNEGLMIANKIEELIKNKTAVADKEHHRAMDYQDIIILLRSRTHVSEYERALRQKSIPYIGAQRGTLLECLEISDMIDLLQWLILPFDNLSLAGILRSPLFSVTNDDLLAIKQAGNGTWLERLENFVQLNPQHESLPRAFRLLTIWQDDASKLPVHDLLDKIYSEANVLARYAAAFPAHLAQRVNANLNRFIELALEMDSGRYPSLTRFSSWLNELRQAEKEAPDEPVASSEQENEQRVRILTVHSAKGLEAPVVFLADSASSPSSNKAYSTLIDWPAEKDKPDYFLLTAAKNNLDTFSKNCIEEQDFFEQREDANLLYVAVTRAKQQLFVCGSASTKKDHGWYEKICAAFNFSSTENQEPVILVTTGTDEKIASLSEEAVKQYPLIPKELSSPILLKQRQLDISPSQQTDRHYENPVTHEENTQRGIVMHQMLNHLSRFENTSLNDFYCSEMQNIDKTNLELMWQECQHTISEPQFIDYFNSSRFDKAYNEVAIQFRQDDNMVYGIIDRLIIKDKKAIIIDYKTHPYVNDSNINTIAQSYEPQINLYRQGVQLLWPDYTITASLLFTAIAKQYDFN